MPLRNLATRMEPEKLPIQPLLHVNSNDAGSITSASGLVSSWNHQIGSSLDLTQDTGDNKPDTGTTTHNGKNTLDFDQADFLVVPSAYYLIGDGSNTTFIVSKTDDNDRLQVVIGTAEGGVTRMDLRYSATIGRITFQSRTASGSGVDLSSITETNMGILMGRRDGTTQAIAFDGSAEVTNTSGLDEDGVDAASVGGFDESTTFGLDGQIAVIISWARSLNTAEIARTLRILSREWGVPLV